MAKPFVLTLLDSTSIQDYIFGSNRLRENIGASELVARTTGMFVQQALERAVQEQHQIDNLSEEFPLEDHPEQRAEILYQGGGNVALLFRRREDAHATVRELSILLLEQAPGLEIAAVHRLFDWETEHLSDREDGTPGLMTCLAEDMVRYKQCKARSAPLAGLGVTLACRSTGLPATCITPGPEILPVSAEVNAKLAVLHTANSRLKQNVMDGLDDLRNAYALPRDFDDLGRSRGESSYMAVVHADGNNIGQRFQQVGLGKSNREYITAVRDLSHNINAAGMHALRATLEALGQFLLQDTIAESSDPPHAWQREKTRFKEGLGQKPYLPFRPLVYGGDDVTFVCDGRLGLALAIRYLHEFEKATSQRLEKPACACAGIAIVKTHYPFFQAYTLAESLCKEAKTFVKQWQKDTHQPDASAIDWHVAASGRGDSPGAIRQREYISADGKLLNLRPLLLHPGADDNLRRWSVFEQAARTLKYHEDWRDRRNKVLALREAFRQGSRAVRHFVTRYQLDKLPCLDHDQDEESRKEGFLTRSEGTRSLYFDAIEALDVFLPLEQPQEQQK